MSKKVANTLDSRNFFVSLISLLLLSLGVDASEAEGIFDALSGGVDTSQLIILLGVNFLNPAFKISKKLAEGTFDWGFWKSKNFQTQIATVIIAAISLLGFDFPEGAATAITINVLNPLFHISKKENNATVQ